MRTFTSVDLTVSK